jgi:hypothetical protein
MRGLRRKTASSSRPGQFRLEELEVRNLMSTTLISPFQNILAKPSGLNASPLSVTSPNTAPLPPNSIRIGYGLNQVQFLSGGNFIKGDGAGQTIAIVDAFNDPNVVSDLLTFDATFGLPDPPNIKILNENGGTTLPTTTSPISAHNGSWAIEEMLDVEWAHVVAPGANIVVFEGTSASFNDLGQAVLTASNPAVYAAYGLPAASVVSNSYGTAETNANLAFEQFFDANVYQPVGNTMSVVFSAGDAGTQSYPSSSPNVLSVGGTQLALKVSPFGVMYNGEVAWSPDPGSTGGGTSPFEPEPAYQVAFGINNTGGFRATPDVSWLADPASGVYVLDSLDGGFFQVGGTSLAAPMWAGLLAVANQGRALAGNGVLTNPQEAIYSLPSADFHDITSGHNNVATAGVGYDEVTGRGSPIPKLLVADLVGATTTPLVVISSGSSSNPSPSSAATPDAGTAPTQVASVAIALAQGSIGASANPAVSQITVALPSAGQVVRTNVTALPIHTATTQESFRGMLDVVVSPDTTSADMTPAEFGLPAGIATPVAVPASSSIEDLGLLAPVFSSGSVSDAVFTDFAPLSAAAATVTSASGIIASEDARSIDLAVVAALALTLGGSWSTFARNEETRKVPALRN